MQHYGWNNLRNTVENLLIINRKLMSPTLWYVETLVYGNNYKTEIPCEGFIC